MIGAAGRRGWRAYADARRRIRRSGDARAVRASFGARPWGRPADWYRKTGERHEDYRRVHPPTAGSIAIVCATARPHRLEALVANAARQTVADADAELIIVTNHAGYAEVDVAGAAHQFAGRLRVLHRDPDLTLGHCLNAALDATQARFVAKFDDDDHYGARHLEDSLRAHGYAGAGVVGKHTYYAHLAATDETVLRFPGHEFSYSSTLAGGTLVIDRQRVGDLQFEELSLGEDRRFIAACHRAGISTFSADRFNFTQVRGDDNEWSVDRTRFLERSELLGPNCRADEIDR